MAWKLPKQATRHIATGTNGYDDRYDLYGNSKNDYWWFVATRPSGEKTVSGTASRATAVSRLLQVRDIRRDSSEADAIRKAWGL